MDKTNKLLKSVAERILEEEGSFFAVVNADMLDLPLEGTQRMMLGGKATPYLRLTDEGIEAGLSINRFHYDAFIPWHVVNAFEGDRKAFYCTREGLDKKKKEEEAQKENRHLRLVKD